MIFEDVKNINKFNIIIEEYILNLQNKDYEKLKILSNVLVDSIDIDEDVESNVKILNYLLDYFDYHSKEELSLLGEILHSKSNEILNIKI